MPAPKKTTARSANRMDEIIENIFNELNGGEDIFTLRLINALKKQHPTLQQGFVRSVVAAIISLKDGHVDDRNLSSVTLGRMLHAQGFTFPMI